LLALVLAVLRAALRSRSELIAENPLLRHQLAVLTRPARKRPAVRSGDKLLWILARRLRRDWRRHLVLVRPETVVRWHRRGWRLFWRWRSRCPLGRPRLAPEVRDLIATIRRDDPLWGTERIRGELLKLGVVVSNRSIRRYPWRGPSRAPSQSWRTFLANHRPHIWAADLFTVQALTFRTLYALVLVAHGRRELVHLAATAHPTAAWVWRQVIEATPWGRTPADRVRDRDAVNSADFARRRRTSRCKYSSMPGIMPCQPASLPDPPCPPRHRERSPPQADTSSRHPGRESGRVLGFWGPGDLEDTGGADDQRARTQCAGAGSSSCEDDRNRS
jgi:hypothetical protein